MQIQGVQIYNTNSHNIKNKNLSFKGNILFHDNTYKLLTKEEKEIAKNLAKYLINCKEDLYIYKQNLLGISLSKIKGYLTTWNGSDMIINAQGRQKPFEKPMDFVKRMCIKATPCKE